MIIIKILKRIRNMGGRNFLSFRIWFGFILFFVALAPSCNALLRCFRCFITLFTCLCFFMPSSGVSYFLPIAFVGSASIYAQACAFYSHSSLFSWNSLKMYFFLFFQNSPVLHLAQFWVFLFSRYFPQIFFRQCLCPSLLTYFFASSGYILRKTEVVI